MISLSALPSTGYLTSQGKDRVADVSGSPSRPVLRSVMSFRSGQEIYGENDAGEHWYHLISGAARKYALLADGRRRIVDFLLPGDFFGFRARHQHSLATEAIEKGTTVARYLRHSLETAADSDPTLGREIRELAFQSISRSHARLLVLGRVTALEKVGSFLVEMADRCSDHERSHGFLADVALRYRRLPGHLGGNRESSPDRAQSLRKDPFYRQAPPLHRGSRHFGQWI